MQWNFTFSAAESSPAQFAPTSSSYKIFLNRVCVETPTSVSGGSGGSGTRRIIQGYCPNRRVGKLRDGSDLYYFGSFTPYVTPFVFDTVNLNAPFAFYILTIVVTAILLFMPLVSTGKRMRAVRGVAAALSTVSVDLGRKYE